MEEQERRVNRKTEIYDRGASVNHDKDEKKINNAKIKQEGKIEMLEQQQDGRKTTKRNIQGHGKGEKRLTTKRGQKMFYG